LNDEKFSDIKEPLTKTINNLADEHIITPEEDFRNNIEQVTKDIFSNPLYDFDVDQKTTDAQNIFLFRTKFEEIKKENIKNIKEEQTDQKEEQKNTEIKKNTEKKEQKETLYTKLMTTYETIEETYKPT